MKIERDTAHILSGVRQGMTIGSPITILLQNKDWKNWHVRVPAVLPDAVLAWLVVAILCFAEVGATKLLDVPGWETASVEAFGLIHYGVYRDLAVLALLSVAFILLPWVMLVWLLRRMLARAAGAS